MQKHGGAGPLAQVAVVMPAYAEEGLPGFVEELAACLAAAGLSVGFVVVDDHSPVPVAEQLRDAGTLLRASVSVLRNDRNRGHGPSVLRAYRAGLSEGATALVHVDGDGQFAVEDVRDVLLGLMGSDVVHARRRDRGEPWYRTAISASLSATLGGGHAALADLNCPLRAYRADVLRGLLEGVPSDSLVPHVHLSRLAARSGHRLDHRDVRSLPRRGEAEVGTMWGSARAVRWLPPRRLLRFCGAAVLECLRVRPGAARPPLPSAPLVRAVAAEGSVPGAEAA